MGEGLIELVEIATVPDESRYLPRNWKISYEKVYCSMKKVVCHQTTSPIHFFELRPFAPMSNHSHSGQVETITANPLSEKSETVKKKKMNNIVEICSYII